MFESTPARQLRRHFLSFTISTSIKSDCDNIIRETLHFFTCLQHFTSDDQSIQPIDQKSIVKLKSSNEKSKFSSLVTKYHLINCLIFDYIGQAARF